jgi:hypothetical protein
LVEEEKSMTDADSIWESKLSRLQDPNMEKMKPLAGLMGELRERMQERAEPRSHAPGPQEGVQRPWWRRVLGR